MIVLRSPKGWTGPKVVDGKPIEGTWRAHQVPVADLQSKPEHLKILEDWMRSYRPEELFDKTANSSPNSRNSLPRATAGWERIRMRMAALLLRDLVMPDFRDYAVKVPKPGTENAEATRVLGVFLRDVMKLNAEAKNFRVFGPDETASNRLDALFEVTDKLWMDQCFRWTNISRTVVGCWRCSASTCARAGWKAICSPGVTASSPATKRLSTSSIPCSISTPSG
jgi:xylulose-5-phosphate/fructose-6-phosphate phosphoketolase